MTVNVVFTLTTHQITQLKILSGTLTSYFYIMLWLREQEPNIVAPPDPLIITGRLLLDLHQATFKGSEQPTAL